ncbi:unnamed protein product [Adineta steineri]|uniref:Purple acid phosphatase n=1 Tax=Adineta steineri TaxID=433720 RepID=A0A814CCD2_9BILA|nr:unnamed protein product [Adineta steineri]CAF3638581.1 unnamed protein product [Adineta steineri]
MLFTLFIVVQCISLVHGSFCILPRSPEQMRVAMRGPNAVTISWRTGGNFGKNDTPEPRVEYSTSKTFTDKVTVNGTTDNYDKSSFFHNVALLNLSPSTTYYYRILAAPTCVRESGIQSFTTAPLAGNPSAVSITLVGDLGNDNLLNLGGSSRTMKGLRQVADKTDFFVHIGDISYADDYGLGVPFEFYEQSWNSWQKHMTEVTANKFYMTGPGNHEVTCAILGDFLCLNSNYKNFSAYLHRFRMPGDESRGYKNLWYSFDYGLVHYVIINTETDFPDAPSGPGTLLNGGNFKGLTGQLDWLKADLEAADGNRAQVPWIIVSGHRPFFGSLPKLPALPGNCDSCRTAFDPLLQQYNVDFYVSGHVHWYERLYPIDANGNPIAYNYDNQPGPIHIINGAGGAPEGKASVKTPISASAKIVSAFGFARLELKDASNARLSFVDSKTMQEVDSVNITRHH